MTRGLTLAPATSDADHHAIRSIRQTVFVEEQACPPDEEWDDDALPAPAAYLLARVGGTPAGCARWRPYDDGAKLERFAVLPAFRGTGVGRALVARTVADATAAGHARLVMHAQAYLVGFYEGFGFRVVGGPFQEAGIEHVKMERTNRPPA